MFDFLKNIVFTEANKPSVKKALAVSTAEPQGLCLRLKRNGQVFPSKELVEHFNLEYGKENAMGFDVVLSSEWGAYPKELPPVIFIAPVPKEEGRVDIFGIAKKDTTSVLTQGSQIEELWDLIHTTYNLTTAEDSNYVDLFILTSHPVTEASGIYLLPKRVNRGPRKGELSYVRRENTVLYPLSPEKEVPSEQNAGDGEIVQEDAVRALNN